MRISALWKRIDPSWWYAWGGSGGLVLLLWGWSWVVMTTIPLAVGNIVVEGQPVLSVFELRTSRFFLYQRTVDDATLTFRPHDAGTVVDQQTLTQWAVESGQAVRGPLQGRTLLPATVAPAKVFPYAGVAPAQNPQLGLWQRFDTNWYLKIAQRGYGGDCSTAFFPLYPYLIRFTDYLTGNSMLSARLLSFLMLVGAAFFFHKLTREIATPAVAHRALLYWLIFPTSFFLVGGYTESTYLFLVLAAFWFARRRAWGVVVLLGVLAALTRLVGALVFLPLAYMWWQQGAARRWAHLAGLALTPLFAALYYFPRMFSSLQNCWHSRFVMPWAHFRALWQLAAAHALTAVDVLNALTVLLFGALCVVMLRKLPLEFSLYALAMFAVPLFRINQGQPFVSMMRYVVVIFPAFIVLGTWGTKSAWVNRAVVYLSLPLLLYLSAQFWLWGWVG